MNQSRQVEEAIPRHSGRSDCLLRELELGGSVGVDPHWFVYNGAPAGLARQ